MQKHRNNVVHPDPGPNPVSIRQRFSTCRAKACCWNSCTLTAVRAPPPPPTPLGKLYAVSKVRVAAAAGGRAGGDWTAGGPMAGAAA